MSRIRIMLLLGALCAVSLSTTLWLPSTAFAGAGQAQPPGVGEGAYRAECRRMTRQIAHYAGQVDLARERGKKMWEEATLQHIGRLSERRVRLCPQYSDTKNGEQLVQLLRLAGKVALKMFTMGLI